MWTETKVLTFVKAIVAEVGLKRAAAACGVSPQMVSYWQTGVNRIPAWHLFALDALTEHRPLFAELAREVRDDPSHICVGSPIQEFGESCKEIGEFQRAATAVIANRTPTNIKLMEAESFEAIDSIRDVTSSLSGAAA